MNSYLPQSFVWDHIRESRQQAAAARQARQARQARTARSARFRAGTHASQAGHRMAGGA
jgi:hypothetical protein